MWPAYDTIMRISRRYRSAESPEHSWAKEVLGQMVAAPVVVHAPDRRSRDDSEHNEVEELA